MTGPEPEPGPAGGYAPSRGIDILVRAVPPGQVRDFVLGCGVLAAVVAKERPGLVFSPQRGAGPLRWTATALAEAAGWRVPQWVDLPIGSHAVADTGSRGNDPRLSGLSTPQKHSLVHATLAQLRAAGIYSPGETVLMLVDEVQNGGTIVDVAHALRSAMDTHGDTTALRVVAAQDQRPGVLRGTRTARFAELAANNRPGIVATVVPLMLFTVDRQQLLDRIDTTVSGRGEEVSPAMFTMRDNGEARALFAALSAVSLNPRRVLGEIDAVRRGSRVTGDGVLDGVLGVALAGAHRVHPAKRVVRDTLLDYFERLAQLFAQD